MLLIESIENVVANFSGRVRREKVGTTDYLVAPLTMLVPGVLNGSHGPIFYPEAEIAKSAPHWDGVPLTDDHLPGKLNGRSVRVQHDYAIGFVQNPTVQNGRLQAEGWFDVERTRRINNDILAALYAGQRIELSTGLRLHEEPTDGIHNGRRYIAVTSDYMPDHLAILLNNRGACSINDGCGVGVTNCQKRQPVGGSLGHSEIDWSSPHPRDTHHVVPPQGQTQQPQQQQQQSIRSDTRGGPVGGSLGPSPSPFD